MIQICDHCGHYNGIVKKEPGIACKIIHDQFDNKHFDTNEQVAALAQSFENICKINKDVEWGMNKMQQEINPLIAYNLMKNIPNNEIQLLSLPYKDMHPIDMIIYYVLVPPVCLRPSVIVSETTRNEDDLTGKLIEVLQLNHSIKKCISEGLGFSQLNQSWKTLQYTLALYINSDTPGIPLNMTGGSSGKGKHID